LLNENIRVEDVKEEHEIATPQIPVASVTMTEQLKRKTADPSCCCRPAALLLLHLPQPKQKNLFRILTRPLFSRNGFS
jgi:hypothetical protein